jgi:hypothetical protein
MARPRAKSECTKKRGRDRLGRLYKRVKSNPARSRYFEVSSA